MAVRTVGGTLEGDVDIVRGIAERRVHGDPADVIKKPIGRKLGKWRGLDSRKRAADEIANEKLAGGGVGSG